MYLIADEEGNLYEIVDFDAFVQKVPADHIEGIFAQTYFDYKMNNVMEQLCQLQIIEQVSGDKYPSEDVQKTLEKIKESGVITKERIEDITVEIDAYVSNQPSTVMLRESQERGSESATEE